MKNLIFISSFACLASLVFSDKPSFGKLPRWRGFNLLEKFSLDRSNKPFVEDDFKMISKLGFNFVRLPMDYRTWIKDGDWRSFNENTLKEIDQAVEWGRKYKIHVCINFHRAPGFCVGKPKEKLSLWKDAEALDACARHWGVFAKRYKGIPNSELSFNLLNEPSNVSEDDYFRVAEKLCDSIRKEDPNRLIIADGIDWGTKPCYTLAKLKIAQAARGYVPFSITHYKAEWVQGWDKRQEPPSWKTPLLNSYLYGPGKKELCSPIELTGVFSKKMILKINIGTVSDSSLLLIKADNKEILKYKFKCGPGEGEWKKAVYEEEWKIYQNIYDKDFAVTVPAGAKEITIENAEGDWLTFSSLSLSEDSAKNIEYKITTIQEWGKKQGKLAFDPGHDPVFVSENMMDEKYLWKECIEPWRNFEKEEKIGIVIGEFGAYNKTPHSIVLPWMEDCLKNWKKAGWGWCLWNFRGDFGILDSNRTDVKYENYNGHKLDREMLNLLQKY
jgi:aryl-phospho-beta-D-glucosidase BglC (GH1 family)